MKSETEVVKKVEIKVVTKEEMKVETKVVKKVEIKVVTK